MLKQYDLRWAQTQTIKQHLPWGKSKNPRALNNGVKELRVNTGSIRLVKAIVNATLWTYQNVFLTNMIMLYIILVRMSCFMFGLYSLAIFLLYLFYIVVVLLEKKKIWATSFLEFKMDFKR